VDKPGAKDTWVRTNSHQRRETSCTLVPRIDATRLIDFATVVYAGAGMPEADARLVADTLMQAAL